MIQEGSDDVERFGQLVDVLLDSELPFKESSLGGGEWQVRLIKRKIRGGAPLNKGNKRAQGGVEGGGKSCLLIP